MSKALVTGAGGFIGRHLARRLVERGRAVRAFDLHADGLSSIRGTGSIEPIQGDIRDRDLIRKALVDCSVVYHLASAHLSLRATDRDYDQVNVDAALALAQDAATAGVKRFVHCSTVGIYGSVKNPPANEETEARPDLIYEKTKWAGEQAVLDFARRSGFPLAVVRPSWVYGPGCDRTRKLIKTIRKGRFFHVGSGKTLRHCVFIDDMLDAFELAAEKSAAVHQAFVIGDARAVTIRELADTIAKVVGAAPPRLRVPEWLIWTAGFAAEKAFAIAGREPPLSRRSLKFFTNNTSFDISKARRMLEFDPKYTLEQGIAKTWDWLCAQDAR